MPRKQYYSKNIKKEAHMNKTYTVMTMNNKELNIGSIYFTNAYLSIATFNPATTKPFTKAERDKLPKSGFTAPENGVIAISSFAEKTILWFDNDGAKAITSHHDPLCINGNNICTNEGTIVATAISTLRKIDLEAAKLRTFHTACKKLEDGIISAYKTDKLEDTDCNSLVVIDGIHFKNAIIEYDCKADLLSDAKESARGFLGIGFRISDDTSHFEGYYIRTTNGKYCTDPVRKAHGCQYFAYPGYVWHYLREFNYEGYEAPVSTIALHEWAHVKVELLEDTAKFYVDDTLVLTMEHNFFHDPVSGNFGFFIDMGTMAYFKNLYIEILD